MEIFILIALVPLTGLVAMSGLTRASAHTAGSQRLIDGGGKSALATLTVDKVPTRFLANIRTGITSIGTLIGIAGELLPKRIGQSYPDTLARLVADTVVWEGWRLEIVDMDGRTIDKVLAMRIDPPAHAAKQPAAETR